MEYVISAVVGAVYGIGTGLLKHFALWWKVLHPKDDAVDLAKNSIAVRVALSTAINAVLLLIVFLVRNVMPFDFTVTLIAAALGLALSGKLLSTKKISGHLLDEQTPQDSLGGLQ